MRARRLAVLTAVLVMTACGSIAGAQPRAIYQQTQYKGQEIGKLTGDVYYARMDDYVSVFMVTPDGIVLVEPIGTEFATWLKGELATRFKVPVKYVIYSHHHWDHGSGAAVYADTARIIGHESDDYASGDAAGDDSAAAERAGAGRQRQRPHRAERGAGEPPGAVRTSTITDRDGALSGAEVTRGPLAFVRPPDLTYTRPDHDHCLAASGLKSFQGRPPTPTTTRSSVSWTAPTCFSRRTGSP